MYNFKKLNNEQILIISDESILKKAEKEIIISTILTNKRLVLLDFPDKTNNYAEALRTSRGIEYVLYKEPILDINLKDIEKVTDEGGFDKYLLNDTNYFYLKDDNIKKKLKEIL